MILLFCVVMAVFLAATYMVVYSSFVKEMRTSLDERLLDSAKPIVAEILEHPAERVIAGLQIHGQLLELITADGQVVERSRNLGEARLLPLSFPKTGRPVVQNLNSPAGRVRAAIIPIRRREQAYWFIIAEPTARLDRSEADFRERAFGLWTTSLLLTTLIAAWYVGRSLNPIVALARHAAQLTTRASRVSTEDLDLRLPISNPNDEVGTLATNFNVLFAQIGAVVGQLRQFVSDAAHELRTPLSVLRGETQFLLSHPRTVEEYQSTLRTIDGELTLMVDIIEGLFTLSMADAGQLRLQNERLYLWEIIEEALGIATPSARGKGIRFELLRWNEEIEIVGDQVLLRQLFLILLDNAIKYSPRDTTVRVRLRAVGAYAEALVEDEGLGISPEHLPHIFERFYRAAPQSSGEARSGGLGLAIAQAIVRAHGGEIQCHSQLGHGAAFTFTFPLIRVETSSAEPESAASSAVLT